MPFSVIRILIEAIITALQQGQGAAPVLDIMARADPADQSGAFDIGKIFSTIGSIFGLKREEMVTMMARSNPE